MVVHEIINQTCLDRRNPDGAYILVQVCRTAKCDAAKKSYELTGEYYLANAEARSFFVFDQG